MIIDIYEYLNKHGYNPKKSKSLDYFNDINWSEVIFNDKMSPSEKINEIFNIRLEKIFKKKSNQNSVRGSAFENLVLLILIENEIRPIYQQCTLQFVPNVRFDFILFENQFKPIILSLKTSLRERYKQVELESYYCKQVYKQSECILITLDSEAVRAAQTKKKIFEILYIDEFVIGGDNDFNTLIKKLKNKDFVEPHNFNVVKNGTLII